MRTPHNKKTRGDIISSQGSLNQASTRTRKGNYNKKENTISFADVSYLIEAGESEARR